MFLSSLLKKISSNDSKPIAVEKAVEIKEDSVQKPPVYLPSWKDKSIWPAHQLEANINTQCQEIKDAVTGLLH